MIEWTVGHSRSKDYDVRACVKSRRKVVSRERSELAKRLVLASIGVLAGKRMKERAVVLILG